MDPPQPEDIFNDALELPPEARPAFLDEACRGDLELRRQIESWLAMHFRHPPPEPADGALRPCPDRIGRYPILREIGRGGMGMVYLAEDPALGRRVALKMLPRRFLNEPDRFGRFHREAQILASLQHPNVATLYSLEQAEGVPFLTMQLVTGQSLADRILAAGGGGLGVRQTLEIAVQIARALEAAHALGIVHRDLKPANVALASNGQVTVLDFGLAKVIGSDPDPQTNPGSADSLLRATGSAGDTVPGAILGSPGYMSPEQIRGEAAGPSSDLWSFGCILHEGLSGRPAFSGTTMTERISATLEREPDWSALPDETPRALRGLLARCLRKDPRERPESVVWVRAQLEDVLADAPGSLAGTSAGAARSGLARSLGRTDGARAWRLGASVAVLSLLTWLLASHPWGRRTAPGTSVPPLTQLTFNGKARDFDVSPDDRRLVYTTTAGELVLRSMNSDSESILYRAPEIHNPRWSPDGTEIAFMALDSARVPYAYIVPSNGGPARPVGSVPFWPMAWTPDGTRLVGQSPDFRIARTGFLLLDRTRGDTSTVRRDPQIRTLVTLSYSPGGEHVLLVGADSSGTNGQWVSDGLGRPSKRITFLESAMCARWSPDGRALLFASIRGDESVMMRGLPDLSTGEAIGSPADVGRLPGLTEFAPYHHGDRLIFSVGGGVSTLWLIDQREDGGWDTRPLLTGTFDILQPRLSPDAREVVVVEESARRTSVTVVSVADGSTRQLTSFEAGGSWPAWSPDGREVVYRGDRGAASRIMMVSTQGGSPRAVTPRICGASLYWYPGTRIRYQAADESYWNLRFLDPSTVQETPLFSRSETRPTIFQSAISPDGQWLAVAGNRNNVVPVWVWLINMRDHQERLLYNHTAVPIGWSEDGQWVYVILSERNAQNPAVMETKVLRVPLDGGGAKEMVTLSQGMLTRWSDADITPDGRRIVVALTQSSRDLWLAEGMRLGGP
jgi:serine/threonine-protein kinase